MLTYVNIIYVIFCMNLVILHYINLTYIALFYVNVIHVKLHCVTIIYDNTLCQCNFVILYQYKSSVWVQYINIIYIM